MFVFCLYSSDDDLLPAVFVRSRHFKPTKGSVVAVTAIAFVFSDKAELTDVVLEDGLTVRCIMLALASTIWIFAYRGDTGLRCVC